MFHTQSRNLVTCCLSSNCIQVRYRLTIISIQK